MPGRVDQVQLVRPAVARGITQGHALRLDRDAPLALERHRVEHLRLHLARLEPAAELDEAVGERGLAVIDVRDDGEVADQVHGAGLRNLGGTLARAIGEARPCARFPWPGAGESARL